MKKVLKLCHVTQGTAFAFLFSLFLSIPVFASGDIAGDTTFDSNVTTDILEPSSYDSIQSDYLKDIGLIFNAQYVTGDFTEKDLPDIFAFVSKYPGWNYSMAMLASAVGKADLRRKTIDFATDLADRNPREHRLQLAVAEILIKYKHLTEAYKYLERAFELAMENPDSAPQEFRKFNVAAVSKYLLLIADASAHSPDSAELRKQLHTVRARIEAVKAFRTESTVPEVLLLSCSQEIASMKKLPDVPVFMIPPSNPRAELQQELDSIAQMILDGYLRRSGKTSLENPNFPTSFRMLHELGRDSELMQSALIRLAEQPDDTEAMLVIALLAAEAEENPLAAHAWDKIFERLQHPHDSMLAAYAKSLREAERFEESSRFYRLYGERTDRTALMKIEVAFNEFRQSRPQDAIAILRDAFECFERSAILSDCYHAVGEEEKAYQALLDAKRLDPERGSTIAFRLQLAFRAEAVGDMETVETELLPLVQAKTKEAEVYNALGYMFALRSYKLNDAEKYLKTALQLAPDSFAILDSYAWLLYKMKKYEQAKESIDKALEKMNADSSEKDVVLLSHAGDIYYMLGYKAQAKDFWKQAESIRSEEADYDGLEWKLHGGTPAQWENYRNMKNPVRNRQQERRSVFERNR